MEEEKEEEKKQNHPQVFSCLWLAYVVRSVNAASHTQSFPSCRSFSSTRALLAPCSSRVGATQAHASVSDRRDAHSSGGAWGQDEFAGSYPSPMRTQASAQCADASTRTRPGGVWAFGPICARAARHGGEGRCRVWRLGVNGLGLSGGGQASFPARMASRGAGYARVAAQGGICHYGSRA